MHFHDGLLDTELSSVLTSKLAPAAVNTAHLSCASSPEPQFVKYSRLAVPLTCMVHGLIGWS